MHKAFAVLLVLAVSLGGCASQGKQQDMGSDFVGANKDAKGCLTSGGYQYCSTTKRCERPWELAAHEGFENNEQAFESFCDN